MGGGDDLFGSGIDLPSFDQFADFMVNKATLGLVGYEGNGQFKAGIVSRAGEAALRDTGKAIKELTGVAAQEEALKQQQAELNRARAEQRQARADEIERRRRQELSASRAAQVMSRNTSNFFMAPTQTTLGAEDSQMLGV